MSQEIKAYDLQNVLEQKIDVVCRAQILSFYFKSGILKMDCLVDHVPKSDKIDTFSILTIASGGVPFNIDYSKYNYGGLVYEGTDAFHMFYYKIY